LSMELGGGIGTREGGAGCGALLDHAMRVVDEFASRRDWITATRGLVEAADFVSTRQ